MYKFFDDRIIFSINVLFTNCILKFNQTGHIISVKNIKLCYSKLLLLLELYLTYVIGMFTFSAKVGLYLSGLRRIITFSYGFGSTKLLFSATYPIRSSNRSFFMCGLKSFSSPCVFLKKIKNSL